MIVIESNAFYTRSDLAELLKGSGVNVDTFIGRLGVRKVFRQLFYGKDVLEAYEAAEPLAGASRKVKGPRSKGNATDRHRNSERRSKAGRKLAREFLRTEEAADE